ncbi:hypothetical protein [Rhizobium sp. BK176]|uniref:hypothetical protein n=1 Tax=Rhizobium sp. BK176 TaxID=2587071 RepID=UPI002168DE8C|nr:hypothetical protein [Rhizobium sp. BK176]MCS4089071.1 hypothetical protein [Rhizobium sp. BK176]
MPQFFVKQPDGKFAVFSTVVDDFHGMGMSEEEALEHARDEMRIGPDDIDAVFGKARRDEPFWDTPDRGDGLNRWRQALVPLAIRHGLETVSERLREMELGDDAIPPEAIRAAGDGHRRPGR